jgi:hypothetical protein
VKNEACLRFLDLLEVVAAHGKKQQTELPWKTSELGLWQVCRPRLASPFFVKSGFKTFQPKSRGSDLPSETCYQPGFEAVSSLFSNARGRDHHLRHLSEHRRVQIWCIRTHSAVFTRPTWSKRTQLFDPPYFWFCKILMMLQAVNPEITVQQVSIQPSAMGVMQHLLQLTDWRVHVCDEPFPTRLRHTAKAVAGPSFPGQATEIEPPVLQSPLIRQPS